MSQRSIEGFRQLNELVSIYYPNNDAATQQPSTSGSPNLIVYCSWMGAAPKHISKYTDGYRRLFPSTPILLIQCTVKSMLVKPELGPAHGVIALHLEAASAAGGGDGQTGISVCMSSNGGATNAVHLAEHFQRTLGRTVFDAMVLDCSPGLPDLASGARAIAVSLPSWPFIRTIGYYLLCLLLLLSVLVDRLSGHREDMITRLRRKLNDEHLFSRSAPRLYLFSRNDSMVDQKAVHEHALDARSAGYEDVKEEIFLRAPHCALINEDPDRYWYAIKDHLTMKS